MTIVPPFSSIFPECRVALRVSCEFADPAGVPERMEVPHGAYNLAVVFCLGTRFREQEK